MCTVTYIPANKDRGFILTSNRDEHSKRETLPPREVDIHNQKVYFPQDKAAGGSWIATNKNGRTCCLLNGGFEIHTKQDFHTISRGKILIDLVTSNVNPQSFFNNISLKNVEPCTIITIDSGSKNAIHLFMETVWDGTQIHTRELKSNEHYIWSSATLYSHENRSERKNWFEKFIEEKQADIVADDIIDFHHKKHSNNASINILVKRAGNLKTVSTTQITQTTHGIQMRYLDLLEDKTHIINV